MRRASHRSQSPGRNINDADNSHTRRRTGILQLILTILRVPLSWLGAIFGRLIGVFLPQGDESGGLLEGMCILMNHCNINVIKFSSNVV